MWRFNTAVGDIAIYVLITLRRGHNYLCGDTTVVGDITLCVEV
jgi:hypothetical protein